MSDFAPSPSRPAAVGHAPAAGRQNRLLDDVLQRTMSGGFDVDAWHAIERRDEDLVAQEVLQGSGSSRFVYSFSMQGSVVSGISVVGARHLAYHYGGIQHRLIGSTEKRGSLFTFTTYPHDGQPMGVSANTVRDLEGEDDFYAVIVEITDVKSGNKIQVEKREFRMERRRDGTTYERPHFQLIAQSKAFRNGVLAIIPQDVQLRWKEQQLSLGKGEVITDGVADEKRAGILRYAAAKGISIDRRALSGLTLDQIGGLSDATRAEGAGAFQRSAAALGLMVVEGADAGHGEAQEAAPPAPAAQAQPRKGRPPRAAQSDAGGPPEPPPHPGTTAAPPPAQPAPAPPAQHAPPPAVDEDNYDPETGEFIGDRDAAPPSRDDGQQLSFA